MDAQIQAINYAAADGREGPQRLARRPVPDGEHRAAERDLLPPQLLHVFAAGNDGVNVRHGATKTFPCAHAPQGAEADNTLCVADTTSNDARFGGSNFGPTSVDLGAPGLFVLSSSIFSDFFFDRFEAGAADFAVQLAGEHRVGAREPKHPPISFGATDSAGGNYPNNTTVSMTSRAFPVPAGGLRRASCRLRAAGISTGRATSSGSRYC